MLLKHFGRREKQTTIVAIGVLRVKNQKCCNEVVKMYSTGFTQHLSKNILAARLFFYVAQNYIILVRWTICYARFPFFVVIATKILLKATAFELKTFISKFCSEVMGKSMWPCKSCLSIHKTFYFERFIRVQELIAGPCSAVGNVSGYRCVSDCRSRGREFDPGPVPYFRGDWSWNDFYGHSPPFRWCIQEGLLSVTSESMCTNCWLTACSSLSRKKSVVRWTDRPAMTIAVDLGRKASKPTNQSRTDNRLAFRLQ